MNTIDCSFIVLILARCAADLYNRIRANESCFCQGIKKTRKLRGLTQEDFSDVSSRTYMSMLERGKKSPTLDKLQIIAQAIGIHCLSLMTLTYMYGGKEKDLDKLLLRIKKEVESVEHKKREP
jgi:transcriptional regulator with XRE-family HTH domain